MLVGVLSKIVEFRNGESGAHVRRIRNITKLLLDHLLESSAECPITTEQQNIIPLASSLHDIGKIAIDEKILNKPGRLTSEGDGSGCYFGMYSHGKSFDLYACTDEKFVFTSTFIAASIALISYALAVSVLLMVRDRSMRAMERQKKEQEESYQARCDSTKYC